jgi:integrase/recombinase XerD
MTLFESARSYVQRKRTAGFAYLRSEQTLLAFCREVGDVPLGHIVPRQVAGFLASPKSSATTWRQKYRLLKNFFEFWAARGGLQVLPMPPILPPCPQIFVPHIYSRTELQLLLRATRFSQKRAACMIAAKTLKTLLLFLYGTGAQIGETLKLEREKVDLKNRLVTLPSGRFDRVRSIPIGRDLQNVLRQYLRSIAQTKIQGSTFFLTRDGKALRVVTLSKTFQRLRRIAGVTRRDDLGYQPRMHDLRHTFAVHRLTSWIKLGADLNRMLPALAAYMSQVGLGSTERYLSMTPERFREELAKLSPQRRKRRWRDNPTLMKFLEEV